MVGFGRNVSPYVMNKLNILITCEWVGLIEHNSHTLTSTHLIRHTKHIDLWEEVIFRGNKELEDVHQS